MRAGSSRVCLMKVGFHNALYSASARGETECVIHRLCTALLSKLQAFTGFAEKKLAFFALNSVYLLRF